MGHKVHPTFFRTNVIYTWNSRSFAHPKKIAKNVQEDYEIRAVVKKDLKDAGIDSIIIERSAKEMTITILAARPGAAIGRAGKGVEDLQKKLERSILKFKHRVKINVKEVKEANLSATVVARSMAEEIEKRMPFRRVMKQAIERVLKAGAGGVKIKIGGRLNGAEIARSEMLAKGKLPLATLRSEIDYAMDEAHTAYGVIGIKVWIYKGERFDVVDHLKEAEEPKKQ